GAETTAANVIAPQTKPDVMARVRAAGCLRGDFVAATVGLMVAPVMVARHMQRPEGLTAIILQREHPDHMQMRRALRMPVFVAEKSQYRNCQRRERVVLNHRCAGGSESKISPLASRRFELARRRPKLFKTN